jgi:hypothetical protein
MDGLYVPNVAILVQQEDLLWACVGPAAECRVEQQRDYSPWEIHDRISATPVYVTVEARLVSPRMVTQRVNVEDFFRDGWQSAAAEQLPGRLALPGGDG